MLQVVRVSVLAVLLLQVAGSTNGQEVAQSQSKEYLLKFEADGPSLPSSDDLQMSTMTNSTAHTLDFLRFNFCTHMRFLTTTFKVRNFGALYTPASQEDFPWDVQTECQVSCWNCLLDSVHNSSSETKQYSLRYNMTYTSANVPTELLHKFYLYLFQKDQHKKQLAHLLEGWFLNLPAGESPTNVQVTSVQQASGAPNLVSADYQLQFQIIGMDAAVANETFADTTALCQILLNFSRYHFYDVPMSACIIPPPSIVEDLAPPEELTLIPAEFDEENITVSGVHENVNSDSSTEVRFDITMIWADDKEDATDLEYVSYLLRFVQLREDDLKDRLEQSYNLTADSLEDISFVGDTPEQIANNTPTWNPTPPPSNFTIPSLYPTAAPSDAPVSVPSAIPSAVPSGVPTLTPTTTSTDSGIGALGISFISVAGVFVAGVLSGAVLFWFCRRRRKKDKPTQAGESSVGQPLPSVTPVSVQEQLQSSTDSPARPTPLSQSYIDKDRPRAPGPTDRPDPRASHLSTKRAESAPSAVFSEATKDNTLPVMTVHDIEEGPSTNDATIAQARTSSDNVWDAFEEYKDPNLEKMRRSLRNIVGLDHMMSLATTRALMDRDSSRGIAPNEPPVSGAELEANILCETTDWLRRYEDATYYQKENFMQELLNKTVSYVRNGIVAPEAASQAVHECAALLGLQVATQLPQTTLLLSGMLKTTTSTDVQTAFGPFGPIRDAAVASGNRGFGFVQFKHPQSVAAAMEQYRTSEIVIKDVAINLAPLS